MKSWTRRKVKNTLISDRPCSRCKKTGQQHYPNGKGRIDSVCRECRLVYARLDSSKKRQAEYRKTNYDRLRQYKLLKRFGLTADQYDDMLKQQNNCCAVCRRNLDSSCRELIPHVDHCHKTGVVRGLLCTTCNAGLGMFKDNPLICIAAQKYLENFFARQS